MKRLFIAILLVAVLIVSAYAEETIEGRVTEAKTSQGIATLKIVYFAVDKDKEIERELFSEFKTVADSPTAAAAFISDVRAKCTELANPEPKYLGVLKGDKITAAGGLVKVE